MTIHKSKGLEYHICYFPGLYETFNTLEIKERFSYDKDFGLILPVCQNGIRSTIYKKMYKEKYLEEEISEKIRLLYVALTRAKEKMIFIGNIKRWKKLLTKRNTSGILTKLCLRAVNKNLKKVKKVLDRPKVMW